MSAKTMLVHELPPEIDAARVVVCDFDRTLAHLDVDWAKLKEELVRLARGALDLSSGIDAGLARLDAPLRGELIARIAEAEKAGFYEAGVRRALADKMAARAAAGQHWAVFSSNTTEALRWIFGSTSLVSTRPALIVGKSDVTRGKPAPEGLFRIREHFGVTPTDMLFVGDSPLDAQAGAAAGVPTVLLPYP
jgi:phosphoglycolate phosphatase-like HAD superfamily hydrolase